MTLTGERRRCPLCRAALWAPRAELLGRRSCPRCGAELWAIAFSDGPVFFPRRPGQTVADLLAELAGPQLGLSAQQMAAVLEGADSLDLVELVTEVEDALRSRHR